jgi:ABC-type phosphate transport system ATPase subunit
LKIIEFRAENIKNLKAIEIRPSDDAVILTGRNGAGKSAILDSIFIALTGKKMEQPIRNGETRAEINVDLGDYRIKRIYTEKGDRLEVLSKDGAMFKSPQTLLNSIFSNKTFDPMEFANMKEKPQRELLAGIAGLDFTELDAKRLNLYNERTIKNREIKGGDIGQYRDDSNAPLPLESLVSKMEVPEPGTPRQEVSMAEELTKLDAMEKTRNEYLDQCEEVDKENSDAKAIWDKEVEEAKNQIAFKNEEVNRLTAEIEQMKKELNQKITMLEGIIQGIKIEETNLDKLNASPIYTKLYPTEPITEQAITEGKEALKEIEVTNIQIRKAIEYDKKQAELQAAKKIITTLESDMIKIDIEKDEKIKAAKFPIEGLGITDACVIYNGKPFSQLSTGEQIRVSTAIAMALNPELKIILIKDGSLLDAEGTKAIMEIAKDKDYQLWIEKCADEKGPLGIYIENGEIKG